MEGNTNGEGQNFDEGGLVKILAGREGGSLPPGETLPIHFHQSFFYTEVKSHFLPHSSVLQVRFNMVSSPTYFLKRGGELGPKDFGVYFKRSLKISIKGGS